MIELLKTLSSIAKKAKRENKLLCFFLGNTKKLENKKYYFTPVRENEKIIFFGAVVYNDSIAEKIAKIVDGKVDYIFVDIEKKVKSKNNKYSLVNIERTIKERIKKSKIRVYKANDLAITSTETLVNNFFLNDKRGLGGKKIIIFGAGNIGFKLALKFVESGAKTFLHRRSKALAAKFAETLNLVKPEGTLSKVFAIDEEPKDLKNFDIIIAATDKSNVINQKQIKNIKKKTLLIDVGKGNFSRQAIMFLNKKKIDIYRLDITPSYFSYIENTIYTDQRYDKKNFSKIVNTLKLVTQGIVGQKNDIIVDDVQTPKKIFGVCSGLGSLIPFTQKQKMSLVKKIKKNIKIDLTYD
tara:strand:- start:1609 stop:2667 length:1059 start_codon:yes stop_codon:yes gene_type:complete